MLSDSYGRVATDLRVSLTDRCNLRCAYCMPAEGLDWLPKPELLTDDEVVRLIRIGVERLGIREGRFSRGEPPVGRGAAGVRAVRVSGRGAAAAPGPGRDRAPRRAAAPPPRAVDHHQRHRPGPD